jgi:hypothetical protein
VPVLQIAADGAWESAAVLPVTTDPPAAAGVVERVAAAARHDVAIEVLWPGELFVGVRWGLAEVAEALAAVRRVSPLAVASAAGSAVSALVSLLGIVPNGVPELAELGAVNAWSSTRPLTLWRRGDPLGLDTEMDQTLRTRPDLTQCHHPVALEIAASDPRPWWVGIVVSTAIGSVHRLDRRLLDDALVRGVGADA